MLYMPLRTARRPVADAARLGVQPTSVYMRVKRMPSSAMRVQVRRLEAANLLDGRDADVTEGRVVPHDVDDVGRPAVLFLQLRQLLVELLVLGRPFVAVLGFEDVVLGVVDDLAVLLCRHCTGT